MCLINRSDIIRYVPLLKELQNYSYVGRYEYPTSQSGTFYPLIRIYVQIQVVSGKSVWGCVGRGGRGGSDMSRVSFTQQVQHNAEVIPGKYGNTMKCT